MHDHSHFRRTLSEFSARLVNPYDVDTVLRELMERLSEALSLDGSGVALAQNGRLEFTTAVPDRLADLEKAQLEHQSGPCVESYQTGRIVAITDLQTHRDRWPEYCVLAEHLGLTSVAGIPMRLAGTTFGALNLYGAGARSWPKDDLEAAVVMADMASSYLINASKLRQQEQLNEQLQHALDSKSHHRASQGDCGQ